jgi:predicted alpha/beta-hydrolase family hydrolase
MKHVVRYFLEYRIGSDDVYCPQRVENARLEHMVNLTIPTLRGSRSADGTVPIVSTAPVNMALSLVRSVY